MAQPSQLGSRSRNAALLDVGLQASRALAREWVKGIDERRRQPAAWSFVAEAVRGYAEAQGKALGKPLQVSPLQLALTFRLDQQATRLARTLGQAVAALPPLQACYQLSTTYTVLLPPALRSAWGAFYTPPALTDRLLDLAAETGTDWATARVLDPACGGGAFLLPVALRMRAALPRLGPRAFLDHLASHLRGFEIDPFAAWLTQVWLETTFAQEVQATGGVFPALVEVCDSLDQEPAGGDGFDLVVGNPPYGRLTLTPAQRNRYRRSLFGHANLYGVFTDLAVRWTKPGGVVAYVTPTSFLAGEYFKALRALLAREAPPLALDFVTARRGVFEDVLQEAALTTYRRGDVGNQGAVHYLTVTTESVATVTQAGRFTLPADPAAPWLAPRTPEDQSLVNWLGLMKARLGDWGYGVSTGPLVWNRFKDQLRSRPGKGTFPLIWAEAVTSAGAFVFRADKRNHEPYFQARSGDEWLKVTTSCVLVQRTTAKEQPRRLIAAELPAAFIAKHGAVVVENHLNMVRPLNGTPKVSPAAVAAVLNSTAADRAFRCISGSVAVSAFELEALPLPSVSAMRRIERLIGQDTSAEAIEAALQRLYFGPRV